MDCDIELRAIVDERIAVAEKDPRPLAASHPDVGMFEHAAHCTATARCPSRTRRARGVLAVCVPTEAGRLIIVVCTRADAIGPRIITGARPASDTQRMMWRKYTS